MEVTLDVQQKKQLHRVQTSDRTQQQSRRRENGEILQFLQSSSTKIIIKSMLRNAPCTDSKPYHFPITSRHYIHSFYSVPFVVATCDSQFFLGNCRLSMITKFNLKIALFLWKVYNREVLFNSVIVYNFILQLL